MTKHQLPHSSLSDEAKASEPKAINDQMTKDRKLVIGACDLVIPTAGRL